MSNWFARNIRTAFKEPQVISAYLRWIASRILGGHGPNIWCTAHYRMAVWTGFNDYYGSYRLFLEGASDFLLMSRTARSADPNHTVAIDVGANLGLFTLNMIEAGFNQVHAFEADPETFARLCVNIRGNRLQERTRLNCLAAGENFGLARFAIAGAAALHYVDPIGRDTDSQSICVATVSLDAYCQEFHIDRIDFLKIDVEGYEPWVIRGMEQLLTRRRVKTILLEICPDNLKRAGSSVHELYTALAKWGYLPHEVDASGAIGRELSAAALEDVASINAACISADDTAS